jgi:hypothetical protein
MRSSATLASGLVAAHCACMGAVYALAGSTQAPPTAVEVYHPDPSSPREVSLAGTVEVPLLTGARGAHPCVEVKVNGRGPYTFLVETGARFVGVSPRLADTLHLRRIGGPDDNPEYWVDEISLGAAAFRELPATALSLSMPALSMAGIDGLLGLPLYQDVLLTLDYPHGKLRLERGQLPEPDHREILPLTRVGDFWGLPFAIGGRQLVGVLDTQAPNGLGLSPSTAAQLPFHGELEVIGKAGVGSGETEVRGGELTAPLIIGRYEFPHPFVAVRALPPLFPGESTIGHGVLKNFVVTLDQRNARLALRHEGPGPLTLAGRSKPAPVGPVASTGAPLPPEVLAAYPGRYGIRTISLRDGHLFLQREGGEPLEMVPVEKDIFTLRPVPEARIEFQRNQAGSVVGLRLLNAQGHWEIIERQP